MHCNHVHQPLLSYGLLHRCMYCPDKTTSRLPVFMPDVEPVPLRSSTTRISMTCVLRTVVRTALCLAFVVGLTGCATGALDRAPVSPEQPWMDPQLAKPTAATSPADASEHNIADSASRDNSFAVAKVPGIKGLAHAPPLDPAKTYALLDLIDLAQKNNPQTRSAWNRAREAALGVGMVEATFLPVLSANVLAGYQRTTFPSQLVIGPREFATDVSGVVPGLALGWLVLDFGKREALLEAAKELSRAANILFNAEHQKVIWMVTTRFYDYNLARERVNLAQDGLVNQQKIAQATRARLQAGMATTVEVALAEQGVMQARLYLVNAQGLERNAYLGLLAAVGLSPTTTLRVAADSSQRATTALKANIQITDQMIQEAIASRPDIAASYAAMKAAQANIKVVESDFFPQVYLGGFLANSNTSFNLQGLPGFTQQANATGVLVGVTLPLFDGGLRSARLIGAQVRSEQASQQFDQLQKDAVREIVLAQTVLNSALESAATAKSLVGTAQIAYDAALASYREGLATMTMVTQAAQGLLGARQALLDANVACEVAAANLGFAMGEMTSAHNAVRTVQRRTGLISGSNLK